MLAFSVAAIMLRPYSTPVAVRLFGRAAALPAPATERPAEAPIPASVQAVSTAEKPGRLQLVSHSGPMEPQLRTAAAQSPPSLPPPKIEPVVIQVVPARIELSQAPPLRQCGQPLLLIATLTTATGEPAVGVPVQWVLHRQGVGEILDTYNGNSLFAVDAKSELALPTYAGTYAAREPYRLDRSVADQPVEIRPGQAWCLVDSRTAGDMLVTVRAPGIANLDRRAQSCQVHWHNVRPQFPKPIVAAAGTQVLLQTKVVDARSGSPAMGYPVRYTIEVPGGARLSTGGSSIEALTDSQGIAETVIQHTAPEADKTRVRAELISTRSLAGTSMVLGKSDIELTWAQPKLLLRVQAPKIAAVSQWVPLAVQYSGPPGNLLLDDLHLYAQLPCSLQTQDAVHDGELDLAAVSDAKDRIVQMTVRADAAGPQVIGFQLRDRHHVRAHMQASIQFVEPTVVLQKRLPKSWHIHQSAEYTIDVANKGPLPVGEIRVFEQLAPGLTVTKASATLMPDRLMWKVPGLEPGEQKSLPVTAIPRQVVDGLTLATRAEIDHQLADEINTVLTISGLAALELEISDQADPIEVGQVAEYSILVRNRGSAAAENVRLELDLPKLIEPLEARGTIPARVSDGALRLAPLAMLPANSEAVCQLRTRALAKGEARLSVRLHHPAVGPVPIESQESTIVREKSK